MNIAVHGASGKLGHLICEMGNCTPIPKGTPPPRDHLIIDVSSAKGLESLLPQLTGQALLVGTTGDLPMDALQQYAKNAAVAVVPNFSVGIPLLLELLHTAVSTLPEGWDIEITEAHHNQKKDAPSGTAKRIQAAIEAIVGKEIPTHSLRVGDTFGEHTVWLCGPGERLELKHVATGREVFAVGALRWARWLHKQPVGWTTP